jgi:hypothetical protein
MQKLMRDSGRQEPLGEANPEAPEESQTQGQP